MGNVKRKIAVFIDADKVAARVIENVLSEVAKYGVVTIRKAYGNWQSPTLIGWAALLHEFSIQPIPQCDLSKGKKSSDIAMVIDAMNTMYRKDIDVMCFILSDKDFTIMLTRGLAEGQVVLGFGERNTPLIFVNACSKFLYFDDAKIAETAPVQMSKNLASKSKLANLLDQAIQASEDNKSWLGLSPVGANRSKISSFDDRSFGLKIIGRLFKRRLIINVSMGSGSMVIDGDRWGQRR